MLDERKLLLIEELVKGERTRSQIAEHVGISRQALYNWLKEPEVVAELDKRLQSIKSFAERKVQSNVDTSLNNLFKLAEDSSNKRVQAQVNMYLVDRALGKPVAKMDLDADLRAVPIPGVDVLENEFEEFDSVNGEE